MTAAPTTTAVTIDKLAAVISDALDLVRNYDSTRTKSKEPIIIYGTNNNEIGVRHEAGMWSAKFDLAKLEQLIKSFNVEVINWRLCARVVLKNGQSRTIDMLGTGEWVVREKDYHPNVATCEFQAIGCDRSLTDVVRILPTNSISNSKNNKG